MKTQHISFLFLLAFIFVLPTKAQKMTVESMVSKQLDQSANVSENFHRDNNGELGGLVKVMLVASGVTFDGWVLEQNLHSPSEYWVFMAKGASYLQVNAPGYIPLEVNFRDYGIEGVESCRTYVLTITLPQAMDVVQQDDGMRYLAMIVKPKNSMVLVDGNPQMVDENGELVVRLPKGVHRYEVSAVGFEAKEGTVSVGDNNAPITVNLVSKQATLRVVCSTKDAEIYVNGQLKGKSPWNGSLMSGQYLVEARLDGYRTSQQSISLKEKGNRTVTFPSLNMISGSLSVECRPIGSDVYVDGKKVGSTPGIFRDIMVGNRRVEVKKEGYESLVKTLTIKENEQTEMKGMLTAKATPNHNNNIISNVPSTPSNSRETFTVKGVSFTMVSVNGGTFMMGATEEQGSDAYDREKPAHEVTLSTYMIGETEVTQALWYAVMGSNPSRFNSDPQNPVESVSWDDCQLFIKKLNSLTGKTFRLPTEAEWEFAARGGNNSKHYKYSGSNTVDDVAWYDGNSNNKTHPVKMKLANELGIYDMSGNVYEWCEDWYDIGYYRLLPKSNPK